MSPVIFVPSGGRDARKHLIFHSDSIRLTPDRMDLLKQLVGPDRWKRQGKPKRTSWDDLEAAVSTYLAESD